MTQPCAGISFYERRCTLDVHPPTQSCQFAEWPEDHDEYGMTYEVDNPKTMADFLEAFSAGGPVALRAVVLWCSNTLYRYHDQLSRDIGPDHILTRAYAQAEEMVKREGNLMFQYLGLPEKIES